MYNYLTVHTIVNGSFNHHFLQHDKAVYIVILLDNVDYYTVLMRVIVLHCDDF